MNNEIYHYGVKGMKWGVRKKYSPSESYQFKTSLGEELTMERHKTPALTKALTKLNPKIKNEVNNTFHYALKDSRGKEVGNFQFYLRFRKSFHT